MKKIALAASALLTLMTMSCTSNGHHNNNQEETDTIEQVLDTAVLEVTGVAIDGAMNSVYLRVGDDTIEFSYPDLDSEHRASWSINDTLTVRYYETEEGDSVAEIINGAIS